MKEKHIHIAFTDNKVSKEIQNIVKKYFGNGLYQIGIYDSEEEMIEHIQQDIMEEK